MGVRLSTKLRSSSHILRACVLILFLLNCLLLSSCREDVQPQIAIQRMAVSSVKFHIDYQSAYNQNSDDYFSRQLQLTSADKTYFNQKTEALLLRIREHSLFKGRLVNQDHVFDNPIYQILDHNWDPFSEYYPLSFRAVPYSSDLAPQLCEILAVDAVIKLEFKLFNDYKKGFLDQPQQGAHVLNDDELHGYSETVLHGKMLIIDRLGNIVFDRTFESRLPFKPNSQKHPFELDHILTSIPYLLYHQLDRNHVDQVFEQFISAFKD